MAALGINLGFFIFQVLNFTLVAVLLYAWAYKPIIRMLETRREKIAAGLEDARVAAEARANAEREANKIISEAQAKAGQVVREATERAEAVGHEVRENAEKEAARQRDTALAEVDQERERMLTDLRGQVAALAMAATQKLIGETLDERRQHELINEFFSGVRASGKTVLEGSDFQGSMNGSSSVEVTSALSLTQEEKEAIRRDILSKLPGSQEGRTATVTFRVNPSILGGLVVRVGDKVWDSSVAGQLENMRQNLV
jgi:F-type H+-transporting ATPase subunit b